MRFDVPLVFHASVLGAAHAAWLPHFGGGGAGGAAPPSAEHNNVNNEGTYHPPGDGQYFDHPPHGAPWNTWGARPQIPPHYQPGQTLTPSSSLSSSSLSSSSSSSSSSASSVGTSSAASGPAYYSTSSPSSSAYPTSVASGSAPGYPSNSANSTYAYAPTSTLVQYSTSDIPTYAPGSPSSSSPSSSSPQGEGVTVTTTYTSGVLITITVTPSPASSLSSVSAAGPPSASDAYPTSLSTSLIVVTETETSYFTAPTPYDSSSSSPSSSSSSISSAAPPSYSVSESTVVITTTVSGTVTTYITTSLVTSTAAVVPTQYSSVSASSSTTDVESTTSVATTEVVSTASTASTEVISSSSAPVIVPYPVGNSTTATYPSVGSTGSVSVSSSAVPSSSSATSSSSSTAVYVPTSSSSASASVSLNSTSSSSFLSTGFTSSSAASVTPSVSANSTTSSSLISSSSSVASFTPSVSANSTTSSALTASSSLTSSSSSSATSSSSASASLTPSASANSTTSSSSLITSSSTSASLTPSASANSTTSSSSSITSSSSLASLTPSASANSTTSSSSLTSSSSSSSSLTSSSSSSSSSSTISTTSSSSLASLTPSASANSTSSSLVSSSSTSSSTSSSSTPSISSTSTTSSSSSTSSTMAPTISPTTSCSNLCSSFTANGFDATLFSCTAVSSGSTIEVPSGQSGICGASESAPVDLCRVTLSVATSDASETYIEVWMPSNSDWNGRVMATDNGGLNGCVAYDQLSYIIGKGFAVVGDNGGHNTSAFDGTWMSGNNERILDWVHRGRHAAISTGKQLINKYYGQDANKAYYIGCSTGGQQGMKSAQTYPNDFDGIIAGSAAIDYNHLQDWSGRFLLLTGTPGSDSFLTQDEWLTVQNEVLRQCDEPIDGVNDGVLEDPSQCIGVFDSSALLNLNLTQTQVNTVEQVHTELYDQDGTLLFPAFQYGAEYDGYRTGLLKGTPQGITHDWFYYGVYNGSGFDPESLSQADYTEADNQDALHDYVSAFNPDLSAFENAGGKLLQYHGSADPMITGLNAQRYYLKVASQLGASNTDLDSFYRLFRISGMAHCSVGGVSGAGAWQFGQDKAASSASTNVIDVIVDWVENGNAPDTLQGTKFWYDTPSYGVQFKRNHCRFPYRTTYDGGDSTDPGSWSCKLISDWQECGVGATPRLC
ncbi:tannase-domain-containing protein [Polychaeton citri CBS 116435]|uniref:Carboxylic ester hydrolase n=1 Tax=Polychaeton citri CBS 116435 TaxID=1314669 RepID=A0A9P4Q3Y4_9PEZI|nr:tannase-domain-containing protein [Polychaeton citri CBS 116435]